jgi:hypothetical protein
MQQNEFLINNDSFIISNNVNEHDELLNNIIINLNKFNEFLERIIINCNYYNSNSEE